MRSQEKKKVAGDDETKQNKGAQWGEQKQCESCEKRGGDRKEKTIRIVARPKIKEKGRCCFLISASASPC